MSKPPIVGAINCGAAPVTASRPMSRPAEFARRQHLSDDREIERRLPSSENLTIGSACRPS